MYGAQLLGERLELYHELASRASLPADMSALKTSTWTYKPVPPPPPSLLPATAAACGEKQLRFRGAEKPHSRRPVQRLQWRRVGKWTAACENDAAVLTRVGPLDTGRIGSMTIADVSPKLAVKRVVMLHENGQYKEAANLINRLSHGTFKVILTDMPVDALIGAIPDSLPVLESLYAKVFLSDGLNHSLKTLRPETVVIQMVKFFAQQENASPAKSSTDMNNSFIVSCKKLLKVIVHTEPNMRKMLIARRKAIEKVIEGMGHHGMVGNSDGSLMSLHDALKMEFERVAASYKAALEKLEEFSVSGANKQPLARSISHGPAPIQVSHQRQLSITQQEIQDRLIMNKTILNVVEPILGNHSLDVFLGILQRRIEHDKDCLFQFTQLKKETKGAGDVNTVAPLLMRFTYGIEQVLKLMREVSGDQEDGENSDISGYHSDSDSAIMTSGNSPYVSKSARYNFLYRSVRATPTQFRGVIPSFSTTSSGGSGGSARGTAGSGADTPSGRDKSVISGGVSGVANGRCRTRQSLLTHESSLSEVSTTSEETEMTCAKGHSLPLPASLAQTPPTRNLARGRNESADGLVDNCSRPALMSFSSSSCHVTKSDKTDATATAAVAVCRHEKYAAKMSQKSDTRNYKSGKHTDPAITAARSCSNIIGTDDRASSNSTKSRHNEHVTHIRVDSEQRQPLIGRYHRLHIEARGTAMVALDALPEMRDSDELKSKLLFSVVVLSFRSVTCTQQLVRETVCRQLQIPPPPPSLSSASMSSSVSTAAGVDLMTPPGRPQDAEQQRSWQLQLSLDSFMQQTVDTYDLSSNVEDVCSQIWATLYDYPCLRSSEGLLSYVKECVRLSWTLINQMPSCRIEYEEAFFSAELHVRQACSNVGRSEIISYVWPALVDDAIGCLYKAVVIT